MIASPGSSRALGQPRKRKTVKKEKRPRRNPLVDAIEAERARATTKVRAANVSSRICIALIQAASMWASTPLKTYQHAAISVPIKAPHEAYTEWPAGDTDFDCKVKVRFAVCVMHQILFGHAEFAQRFFFAAMGILLNSTGGSHLGATVRAINLFREAKATVLVNLAGIQALAVAVIPQGTLMGVSLARAAQKSGLESVSVKRRPAVYNYKRKFAQTPSQLCADLGMSVIKGAHADFVQYWESIQREVPSCQGRCGQPDCDVPVVDLPTFRAALIDCMW
jgi:hypothetical protein